MQKRNDKVHYVYRVLLLVLYAGITVLYLSPFPYYLTGSHSRKYHTLFIQHSDTVGTESDLTYIPAFPIYTIFFLFQIGIIYLAVRELLFAIGVIKPKPRPFPAQPHQFGTAPDFLVPLLRDLRINQSSRKRADAPPAAPLSTFMAPRVLYIGFLWLCTWPLPLLTFGVGSFDDSIWWSVLFLVASVHLITERTIAHADRETVGLNGLKYSFKSA